MKSTKPMQMQKQQGFVFPGGLLKNIMPETRLLVIYLSNGKTLQSTHTVNLYLSWLPKLATQAHVVPGISHTSLLSIKMLCNTVCKVSYDKDKCLILYNNKILLQGTRESSTIFWILPCRCRNNRGLFSQGVYLRILCQKPGS